jgi:ankyrin repeat protein
MFNRLLERGHPIDPPVASGDMWYPLECAVAAGGDVEIMKTLWEKKGGFEIEIGNIENNPLYHAATGGHLKMMQYLVSIGFDPTDKDSASYTLLHYVCRNTLFYPFARSNRGAGKAAIVDYIVSQGVDINARSSHGYTAWDEATPKVRRMLEARGAIPTGPSEEDETYLEGFLKDVDEFEREIGKPESLLSPEKDSPH